MLIKRQRDKLVLSLPINATTPSYIVSSLSRTSSDKQFKPENLNSNSPFDINIFDKNNINITISNDSIFPRFTDFCCSECDYDELVKFAKTVHAVITDVIIGSTLAPRLLIYLVPLHTSIFRHLDDEFIYCDMAHREKLDTFNLFYCASIASILPCIGFCKLKIQYKYGDYYCLGINITKLINAIGKLKIKLGNNNERLFYDWYFFFFGCIYAHYDNLEDMELTAGVHITLPQYLLEDMRHPSLNPKRAVYTIISKVKRSAHLKPIMDEYLNYSIVYKNLFIRDCYPYRNSIKDALLTMWEYDKQASLGHVSVYRMKGECISTNYIDCRHDDKQNVKYITQRSIKSHNRVYNTVDMDLDEWVAAMMFM